MTHILMISMGDEILRHPQGDTAQRHLEYAERLGGRITMVTRSPRRATCAWGTNLEVFPTGAMGYAGFVRRAIELGRRICTRSRPDLIATQDPFGTGLVGALLKARFGVPLLVQNHSSCIDNPHWIAERPALFRAFNLLAKWVLPRADGYRVVNEVEGRIYREQLGLPAERIAVLPVPVDVERFAQPADSGAVAALRSRLGLPPGAEVLLWVGRPVRFKRLPFLLQAFANIVRERPAARLVLVGDPAEAQEDLLAVQAQFGLGEQVVWAGYVPYHDLPLYYAMADLYVHTSSYEGFGRVMLEAAAARCPTLATRSAGAEMIVRDGVTGYLTERDDRGAFVARALGLLASPPALRMLGQAAQRRALVAFQPDALNDGIVAQWRTLAAREVMQ